MKLKLYLFIVEAQVKGRFIERNWVCCVHEMERWWHGFYRPKIFHPTLLAKQGRWILNNTNTLLNRTLMLSTLHRIASSCMEAQLKPNASYVWKSILEAQDIIVKDLRWRLGKKRSMKILGITGYQHGNTDNLSSWLTNHKLCYKKHMSVP